jgi:hypothetical protein
MRYSIGIDVGMDGAVALVSEGGFMGVWDTPTLTVERPRDRKAKSATMRVYDKTSMRLLLKDAIYIADHDSAIGPQHKLFADLSIVIEKVHAMPDQGATSMFTFGRGLGLWEGIADGFEKPLHMPAPQTWKKVVMRDGPKTKEAAVQVVQALYPAAARHLRGPNGGLKVDRAEAILMAHYGLVAHTLVAAGSPRKSRTKRTNTTVGQQLSNAKEAEGPTE